MNFVPEAGRRPAVLSILLLAVAAWISVPLRVLIPQAQLDLGFTLDNTVFVVENAAMMSTVVLALGSVALRAQRLLVAAAVVAGVHLLFQLGTAVVQLVLGARPELILGTLVEILVLAVVLAGVLLALLLRDPRSARRTGLVVALVGAVVHTLWTSVLLPLVSMLPYGDLPPGMVGSLLLTVGLNLLAVAAAPLCGWAAPTARRIGALLAAVVGVLGIVGAVGSLGPLGVAVAAMQALQGLLTLSAVPFAVVAGRRLATAATPPDAVAAEA